MNENLGRTTARRRSCAATWQTPPPFDAGRKRFHYEHVVPVSALIGLC